MPDLPDWNRPVQTSGLKYVGSFDVTIDGSGSGSGQLAITLRTLDRAIVIFAPTRPSNTSCDVGVSTSGPPALATRYAPISSTAQMVVGYCNPDLSASWIADAAMTGPAGGPYTFQVFTDTELPMISVEPGSAHLAADVSVLGATGQQPAGLSLPVVLPADQSPIFARPKASAYSSAQPGVGVQGSITFPGVAGRQYRIAWLSASFTATPGAAAANQALYIRDGASGVGSVIWAIVLSTDGTNGHEEIVNLVDLPITGTAGNPFTVEFGAGAAAYFEWLAVGVYF